MKQFLDSKKLLDFYKNKLLLVFGYGSLMWNPDFEYQSSGIFILQGFYRDFCVYSTHYRGTEKKPGLVLGLRKENNRNCIGKLFVVAEENKAEVLSRLWEREMLGDIYIPTVLPFHKKTLAKNLSNLKLPDKNLPDKNLPDKKPNKNLLDENLPDENLAGEIFTFVANSQSVKFCQLPNEKKSEIIQSAKGREGACMDYIKNTQQELQKFKISDPAVDCFLE